MPEQEEAESRMSTIEEMGEAIEREEEQLLGMVVRSGYAVLEIAKANAELAYIVDEEDYCEGGRLEVSGDRIRERVRRADAAYGKVMEEVAKKADDLTLMRARRICRVKGDDGPVGEGWGAFQS